MPHFPAFEHFPSRWLNDGAGRAFRVHGRIELIAFWIQDGTIEAHRSGGGFILYAFTDGDRVGYWNSTTEPRDLEWVMETYRAALEHRPIRPNVPEPRIRPTYNRDLAAQLRAVDVDRHLDVSAAFGDPEQQADVIPLHRKR